MKVSFFSKKKWPEKTESFRIKFLKEQEIYNKISGKISKRKLKHRRLSQKRENIGRNNRYKYQKKLEGLKETIIIVIFFDIKEILNSGLPPEKTNSNSS